MKINAKVFAVVIVVLLWLSVVQAAGTKNKIEPIVTQNSEEKVKIQEVIKKPFAIAVEKVKQIKVKKIVKKSKVSVNAVNHDWDSELAKYPWDIETARRIMMCESGGNQTSQNSRSSAGGLFQIIDGTWSGNTAYPLSDKYDGVKNIEVAYHIYSHQGFSPWVCK